MKQKKIGTTLYVFETSAYEITRDTDAKEICIQQEDLEAFIKLNQAIADKMQPYNYSLLTVKKTVWADYIDAPDIYSIMLTGDSGELVEVSAESSEAGETITVTPKTGYTVANVNVTSSEVEVIPGETNWTFTMPESDVVLLAAIDTHLINTEGDSSAVTVSDNQAKDGDVVTITPTQGFSTVDVELASDEVNFNTGESGWTFVMPDEDVTISVTLKAYNITAAGDSSYITVANSAKVGSTVTVTPANGATMNTISIVVSGGVEVTAGAEAYTFTMPGNDVTVTATLASHTITTDGDATYISVANSAKLGDTVEVTPANGASVDNVSIVVSGGVEVTKGVSSYTFTMPNNNVTVTATAASYSITRSGDSNYYVVENTAKMGTTVEVVPTNGATVDTISFSATGITFVKGVDSYTFTMPMENVTITGTLATHSISTAGDNAYMTVSQNTAKLGQVVSVTPINGATMSTLSIAISGVTVTAGTTAYLFIMPNEDITITATLASFNISAAGDSSYISVPASAKMFSTVEVTPINGGDMSSVSITVSGDIPVTTGTTSYTFTMPANDVTVTATYVEPHHDYSQDYLTFTASEPSTFKFVEAGSGNSLEYSLDNGTTWTSLASDTASPTVNTDGKIIWRGQRTSPSSTGIGTFSSTGSFVASGNVLSLLNGDNFRNVTTLTDNKVFYRLFKSCGAMTNAENLVLPATTLTANCYQSMFEACTGLSIGPALPATTLANNCYQDMYYGCTSLTTAPALPATTLAIGCYQSMFNGGCTSLTTPPALPATILATNCYQSMFRKSGLTTTPALPATTLASSCYQYMFRECTSLTTAPTLSAPTLTDGCYSNMFYGCTSLNYVKCLATDISASSCVFYWLSNVAATGTFIKSESMTNWTSGSSGIPNGWTVQNTPQYAITVTGDTSYVNIPSTAGGDSTVTITPINGATRRHLTITVSGDIPVTINATDFSFVMPNNAVTINVVYDGASHDYSQDYFTLTAIDTTEFTYTSQGYGDLQYSLDNGTTWVTLAPASMSSSIYTTPTVNAGESIMFKSQKTTFSQGVGTFDSTRGRYDASGNVQSISYGGSFKQQVTVQKDGEFKNLFYYSTKLLSAEDLILSATYLKANCYYSMFEGCTRLSIGPSTLPATTLLSNCYMRMFYSCRALTTAPTLPATTLASNCYNTMFSSCSSLTTAPTLSATTLADYCYNHMFTGCTSLTTAPALPATTLGVSCYGSMFNGCRALTTVPATLPATTLANNCYEYMFSSCSSLTTAPALPATTLADNCYDSMFGSCTGLTTAPSTLPATTLTANCYKQMFYACSSLTTAPATLPAPTLATFCYNNMFYGCGNLIEITCLATDISAQGCTTGWVTGVNASGTFYKDSSMQDWTTGNNGIPSGWTVQDAA